MVETSPGTGSLKRAMSRKQLIGTFVKMADLAVIEICAHVGFDFVIIDLQHSQLTEGQALRLVHHAWTSGLPSVVRVPTPDGALSNRLLEAGVRGIQLAEVRSVEEVKSLVAATRYPPHGRRSVSLSHPVARYGAVPLRDAVAVPPPLIVGQIETADTIDPIPDILRSGLDVAFLGMTDLTVDFGFDDEKVRQRVQEVTTEASLADVALGTFAARPDRIPEQADYVAVSSDVTIFTEALSRTMAAAR